MRHELQDRVSLEIARRVASELPHRPDWLSLARDNLTRWIAINAQSPGLLRCYEEWRVLLNQPLADICALLTAQTDDAQRLRQNSPFVGALSPQEVWDIKSRVRHDQTAA